MKSYSKLLEQTAVFISYLIVGSLAALAVIVYAGVVIGLIR